MSINLKDITYQNNRGEIVATEKSWNLANLLNREISLFGKELSDRKKENFYSELAILFSSGIDIRTALDIIVDEQTSESDRLVFLSIKNDIVGGMSLADAIDKTGRFSTYEFYSLKIGEETGGIKEVLTDLTVFFSKKIKQRKQLTTALTYPTLIVVTAIIAVTFMLNFIVPMFVDVFRRFNGEMPVLTQKIISLSAFFKSYIIYIILAVILISAFLFSIRKTEFFRFRSSQLLISLPLVGKIIRKLYLSRFCHYMALLLGTKTPMLSSLNLVKKMIVFYPFEQAIKTMESDIMHGKLLHQSMEKFKLFDKRVVSLVRMAEEVNQLDNIFLKLNDQYSDELEHQIGMLSSLLEPVMIIVVGGLVSIILISMYLPLFQLSTSIY